MKQERETMKQEVGAVVYLLTYIQTREKEGEKQTQIGALNLLNLFLIPYTNIGPLDIFGFNLKQKQKDMIIDAIMAYEHSGNNSNVYIFSFFGKLRVWMIIKPVPI